MKKIALALLLGTVVLSQLDVSDVNAQTPTSTVGIKSVEETGTFYLYNSKSIQLYSQPNTAYKDIATLGPQVLTASKKIDNWYLVNTWIGPKWVLNTNNVITERKVSNGVRTIHIKSPKFLNNYPFDSSRIAQSVGPQTVYSKAQSGNWFLISTWIGDKWIYVNNDELSNGSISEPSKLRGRVKGITYEDTLNIRSGPGTGNPIVGTLDLHQSVDILGLENGWAKIKHTNPNAYVSAAYLDLFEQVASNEEKINSQHIVYSRDTVHLFNDENATSGTGAYVGPQVLTGVSRKGNIVEVKTWLGNKYMNLDKTNESYVSAPITYEQGQLDLTEKSFLYNQPFDIFKSTLYLSPQKVTYTAKSRGWYLINTWVGQMWVKNDTGFLPLVPQDLFEIVTSSGIERQKDEATALTRFASAPSDAYLIKNGQIHDMKSGFARTTIPSNETLTIKKYPSGERATYVAKDTEFEVVKIEGERVFIRFAGINDVYVEKSKVQLIPSLKNEPLSHYTISGGKLVHKLYVPSSKSFASYILGYAPNSIVSGKNYYSFDVKNISGNADSFGYFQFLPVRSKSNYSAAELAEYVKSKKPTSPLILDDNGQFTTTKMQYFIDAGEKYNLNAAYLLAHAIHESAWGTSTLAKTKNNLFGLGANDSNPLGDAQAFATLQEGIDKCAKYISEKYLTPGGWIYQGGFLGDKSMGMNVNYASDAYWGAKIAGYMHGIDSMYGNKELNKEKLGLVKKGTPYYDLSNGKKVAMTPTHDSVVRIKGKVTNGYGTFFEVYPDNPSSPNLFIAESSIKELTTY